MAKKFWVGSVLLLTAAALLFWWRAGMAPAERAVKASPVAAHAQKPEVKPEETKAITDTQTPAAPVAPTGTGRPTAVVFGLTGPVTLEDVPPGRFHDQLAKLPSAARERALKHLGDSHIPLNDVESLSVDRTGMLVYACNFEIPANSAQAVYDSSAVSATASADGYAAAPVPISSPPVRHSKPGATNVIYLDFNGHTVTGTAWNDTVTTYVAKPFDKDGDPTTFSDVEQADIIHVWERVAEDYGPFNVDVTTEEPVSFTATTGRVLITSSVDANGQLMPANTGGGVAYVGVFGASYYGSYSPAFVYADHLGPNGESYIAEAASHEMGHNMGLSHDGLTSGAQYYGGHGSGETSWGPIMGTGYNRNVSQWSKGEYYLANNTEDDLAIIAGKLGYQPDDHPDSNLAADPVTANGGNISAQGVIGQPGDADRFKFMTGAGNVSITVSPFRSAVDTYGGNLDAKLELIDAANSVIATADPATTTGLTLNTTLTAGTYYLRITGTGVGNPLSATPDGYTSYASLGAYTVSGAVTVAAYNKYSAGRYHSLRLDGSSQLYATGTNANGQLGTGNTTTFTAPQLVTLPGQTVVDLAAGAEHSLFLTSAKELWATGYNATGQLGDGTLVAKSTPFRTATSVAGIAAGRFHSAFLKTDGTLWTVGGNDEGQLGNGTQTDTSTPVQIAINVVDVAAGIRQTLFVKADGTLWGTGDLYNNGTLALSPIQIATGVRTVAAGGYHSLILKADGTLWSLGFNAYGQLGTGNTTTATTPVQIATGVKAIATGYFHSVFIKTDNTLWAFGYNSGGQLGDGTTTSRSTPFQLASNVAAVSASEAYTLFSKPDGTLWGTGYNAYGQFGNGGTAVVTAPVQISVGTVVAPSVPTSVVAAGNAALDRMNLTWQPSGSAATYEVWRSATNSFGSATRLAQNIRWAFYQDMTASVYTTYYYWITSVNPAGTSAPSTVQVGAYGTPISASFTTQPLPQTVAVGGTGTFTVVTAGFPAPTLLWQRLPAGSGTWTDLANAGSYSGVTTATLTVSSATTIMSGDQFRCIATNSSGTVNSNAALLTVTVINDFNGDGKSDIVWENITSGDRGFWLMNGTSFASWDFLGNIPIAWRIAATADFNGDGKPDLLWENTATGDRYVWFMNGTAVSSAVSIGNVPVAWHIAAAADFNSDGKPDILWENTATGDRYLWLMNGTTVSSALDLGVNSTDWHIAAAADFNGDGQTDILWENTVTGLRGFWLMNGTTFSSWKKIGVVSIDWHIAAVGDFDGDGKTDILWENTLTGDRGFWLMNGTAFSSWQSMGVISTDWRIAP